MKRQKTDRNLPKTLPAIVQFLEKHRPNVHAARKLPAEISKFMSKKPTEKNYHRKNIQPHPALQKKASLTCQMLPDVFLTSKYTSLNQSVNSFKNHQMLPEVGQIFFSNIWLLYLTVFIDKFHRCQMLQIFSQVTAQACACVRVRACVHVRRPPTNICNIWRYWQLPEIIHVFRARCFARC